MRKQNVTKKLVGAMLVLGVLFFSGCALDEEPEKSLKITGISLYNGDECGVYIYEDNGIASLVAIGYPVAISGGTVTIPLYSMLGSQWTGTGSYWVDIEFLDAGDYYESIDMISFASEVTTVNLSDFDVW
ncbi:hypothetical protein K7I13_01710 [Brucepastera parasyntrophica]|uniref:hypothetical protein n=1 Tax=Brucepastera parasyntrophica TaxID=2880008 RepID=UPI00210E1DB1|nr:hypothetical protein [Brucepastera parasyntrophica]ULQ60070.1 hypothetical protein K7I13_01710 [Brucepastera parasyntrophica]